MLIKIRFIQTLHNDGYILEEAWKWRYVFLDYFVDDVFITTFHTYTIEEFTDELEGHFNLKYFGEVNAKI